MTTAFRIRTGRFGKIGVLLVNLGTPDAPMRPAVRRYLKEFLTDPRVIEDQGLLWRFVLNGIILPFRPRRKARDYRKIWNNEKNESPLKTITRAQAEKLAASLAPLGAISSSIGPCATATPRSPRGSRLWWRRAATASW